MTRLKTQSRAVKRLRAHNQNPEEECRSRMLKNYVKFELHSYKIQTLDSFHFIDADLSLFLGFSDC